MEKQVGLTDLNYAQQKWGWFALLGTSMLLAGVVALICTTTTTMVTVMFLGWFLFISGGVQLIETFGVRTWGGFLIHLLNSIFQMVVGLFIIAMPPAANAILLTFMFAILLMVSGLFRMIAGLSLPLVGGLVSFSGFTSVVLGFLIWRGWPDSSLWFIGMFVAIDLIMHGTSWLAFALRARSLAREGGLRMKPAIA